MTTPATLTVIETKLDTIETAQGRVAVIVPADGKMSAPARRVNRPTKGALKLFIASYAFANLT